MPLTVSAPLGQYLQELDGASGPLHQAFLEGVTGGYTLGNLPGYNTIDDPAIQKVLRQAYLLFAAASGQASTPTWRNVGETANPPFLNSWVNFESGHQVLSFRREGDLVRLRGGIRAGAGAIFILPEGYRPAANLSFPIATNLSASPATASIFIATTGVVTFIGTDTTFVPLNGIAFSLS